jgi:hypothetical protein
LFFAVKGVVVPTTESVFPDELYPASKSWAEQGYAKLIHYNKMEKGGHFRGLGTAAALFRRGSCGLQRISLVRNEGTAQEDPMTFETLARKEGAARSVRVLVFKSAAEPLVSIHSGWSTRV